MVFQRLGLVGNELIKQPGSNGDLEEGNKDKDLEHRGRHCYEAEAEEEDDELVCDGIISRPGLYIYRWKNWKLPRIDG